MFAFLEGPDLLIVLAVVVVLFGGSQLPKLAKNIGKAQREFKEGLAEGSKSSSDKSDAAKSDSAKSDGDA